MLRKAIQLSKRHGGVELLKLIVVGALQNGGFYLLALLEVSWGFASWQTFAVNYPLSVLLTFVANRGWVFSGRANTKGQMFRYVAVYLAIYVFAIVFSNMLERLSIQPAWAILLTMAPAAVILFLALNLWVFPASRDAPKPPLETNA